MMEDDDFDLTVGWKPAEVPSPPPPDPGQAGGRGRGRASRITGKKARGATGQTKVCYSNCNVCMDTDMAPGMKQCKKHNKDVRAIDDSLKDKDASTGTKSRKEFQELRDNAPDYPPSQFANVVIEFGQNFPSQGSGKKRGHTAESTYEIVEKHVRRKQSIKGTDMEMMHEAQWIKLRVETQCHPYNEAKEMWDTVFNMIDEEMCDQEGPKHSPHRQPMPQRSFISIQEIVEHMKEIQVRSAKRQKLTGAEQLATLQKGLNTNSVAFNNDIFAANGGKAAAAALTACGSTHHASSSSSDKNIFAEQLEEAAKLKQAKKAESQQKEKFFDVEVNKNRLLEKFENIGKNLKTKIEAARTQLEETIKLASENANKEIPNLPTVVLTMKSRKELLPLLVPESADEQFDCDKEDTCIGNMHAIVKATVHGSKDSKMKKEEADKIIAIIKQGKMLSDEKFKHYIEAVLAKHGFRDENFVDVEAVPLDLFCEDFKTLSSFAKQKLALDEEIKLRLQGGKPMPVPAQSIEHICPITFIKAFRMLVAVAATEQSMKILDDSAVIASDCLGKMIGHISKGAHEVSTCISRFNKKKETEQENLRKKEAKKKIEDKDKVAKSNKQPQNASSACILDLNHEHIKEMQSWDSEALFETARAEGNLDPSRPWTILSAPSIDKLAQNRVVKQQIGIFKIQFPTSNMCQNEHKGHIGLTCQLTKQIREQMINFCVNARPVPDTWKDKPIERMTSQVGICGLETFNPGFLAGLERQGFATCRYQEAGTREMIAIEILGLVDYATSAGKDRTADETYFQWLERIMKELNRLEEVEKLKDLNVEVLRASALRPGSFAYIPAGYMIMERAVGDLHSYSLRTPSIDATPESAARFKNIMDQAKAAAGEGDSLMKIWQEYCDALQPTI